MPKLTRKKIEEYLEREAEVRRLRREASDLSKFNAELEELLTDACEEAGGQLRTCGHLLQLETKAGSVSWKTEFVRVAGEEAAEKLIQAAPPKTELVVQQAK